LSAVTKKPIAERRAETAKALSKIDWSVAKALRGKYKRLVEIADYFGVDRQLFYRECKKRGFE